MPLQNFLKGHLLRVLCLLPLTFVVLYGLSIVTMFHAHYLKSLHQQQEGLWLFTQCQETDFHRKLSQHSDACDQMSVLFQKTPLTLAMEETLDTVSRQFYEVLSPRHLMLLMGIMMAPLVLFILTPIYFAWAERHERDRLAIIAFHTGDAGFIRRAAPLRLQSTGKLEHVHESTKMRWRGQTMRV